MESSKVTNTSPKAYVRPLTQYQTKVAQQYDLERTLYYQSFLREMLKSIYEDGVNVVGALAWSLQ
jgi:beta-glucosidase/6-phospho-beta-glucosidase/beta-galactosidase